MKYLELNGFKSFADPLRVEFQQGVTAVVGPNGCGKSNVVESILWVLGEQSLKNLRSSSSHELIFGGSQSRPSLGMGEVTLCFDNKTRFLPVEQDEVTVTRRIYRSGESEFLINKEPCRLKDIHRLFLDTGLGLTSYSVLRQGTVEKIVNARPEELRLLFDEAIGVTRFRVEKEEVLRNLERTRDGLARLSDIVEEVRKNLASLDYQSQKARSYKKIRADWEKLKVNSLCRQHSEWEEKKKKIMKEWEEREEKWNGWKQEIKEISGNLDEMRFSLERKREELQDKERKMFVSHHELGKLIQEKQSLFNRREEVPLKIEEGENRLKGWGKEKGELDLKAEAARKDLEAQTSLAASLEEKWKQAEAMLAQENIPLVDGNMLEDKNQQIFEEHRNLYTWENRVREIEGSDILNKLDKIRKELDGEQTRIGDTRRTGSSLEEEVRQTEQILGQGQTERVSLSKEKEVIVKSISQNDKEIAYQEGVKKSREAQAPPRGVLGRVEDFVRVPSQTLRAYLGTILSAWIIEDRREYERLIAEYEGKEGFNLLIHKDLISSLPAPAPGPVEPKPGWENLPALFPLGDIDRIEDKRVVFKWGGVGVGKIFSPEEWEKNMARLGEEKKNLHLKYEEHQRIEREKEENVFQQRRRLEELKSERDYARV
ncbi:MAG TPA: AAA family ATPase, partial [bacterium]|nr:AAA family ATPase [bacterium]